MHPSSSSKADRMRNLGQQQGTIADTIAGARASLKNPSRPYTPADPLRRLQPSLLSTQLTPPATPLLSLQPFEAERPFTGRPATSARHQRLMRQSEVENLAEKATQVLILDDDDTESVGTAGLSRVPSTSSTKSEKLGLWHHIEPLLPVLRPSQKSSEILKVCDKLQQLLSQPDAALLVGTSQRSEIVRSAARCLESSEPRQLAKLAGVILLVTKGGPNLLACAKILFKLSKSSSNDELFFQEALCHRLVVMIGESRVKRVLAALERGQGGDGIADAEAFVYLLGVLKNISATSAANQKALLDEGAVDAITTIVREFCSGTVGISLPQWSTKVKDTIFNLLLQATGALRNLAVGIGCGAGEWRSFVQSETPCALKGILVRLPDRTDLVLNVMRVLSKLSLAPECRLAVLYDARADVSRGEKTLHHELVRLVHQAVPADSDHTDSHADAQVERDRCLSFSVAIRACFILGNLCAEDEEHRLLTAGWLTHPPDDDLDQFAPGLRGAVDQAGGVSHPPGDDHGQTETNLNVLLRLLHRLTGDVLADGPASTAPPDAPSAPPSRPHQGAGAMPSSEHPSASRGVAQGSGAGQQGGGEGLWAPDCREGSAKDGEDGGMSHAFLTVDFLVKVRLPKSESLSPKPYA